MKAKTIQGKSPEEIERSLEQNLKDARLPDGQGFVPTLAIVFISIKQDRESICALLHKEGIDILGATSCGEFSDGYQDEGSAVILLLDINPEYYTILFEDIGERKLTDVATKLAHDAQKEFENPGFVLCSTGLNSQGELLDGDSLMRSIEEVVGPQVNIYGGMAGDDWTFTGTRVFTWGQESDYAIAALVLDQEKISMNGMAVSGWKPLGIQRTVTKVEEGWIYTIDDKPALEMYLKYLGNEEVPDEDKHKLFEDLGVHYPFLVEGVNDPKIRTPFLIDREKNAIKLDYDVPQGTKFRFLRPPDFDIVEDVLKDAGELKKAKKAEAEALLIFSCAGRFSALGPFTKSENEGLHELWNAPMAGFFSYGEYGTTSKGQEFHSTTFCWVALKEK